LIGSRWVSGKGATSAGLVGTVVRDALFSNLVVLQKGALPMANQKVCLCDELDKMNKNDTDALHEPLENQFCFIDKWNKHQGFKTDMTLIATANPIHGRFDLDKSLMDQIALPQPLKDRFDLIMPFIDTVGDDDLKLAESIFRKFEDIDKGELLDNDFLVSYLYYSRTKIRSKITADAKNALTKYYLQLRIATRVDSSLKVNISARNMEALARLTIAKAKLRLSSTATVEDAKDVIDIVDYFFRKLGLDSNISKSTEEQFEQEIGMKCYVCAADKSSFYDDSPSGKGRPICKLCYKAKQANRK
jgi:DNA replicative helicase MCM subunit Mcm2 (Cdc46/Mcm family)